MRKGGCLAAVAVLSACTTEADQRSLPAMVAPRPDEGSWLSGEWIVDPAGVTPPVRTGVTSSGYQYQYGPGKEGRIFAGSGASVVWRIECQIAAGASGESCRIQDEQGRLQVNFAPTGLPQDVCILPHGGLGRTATIRLDQQSSAVTDWGGCTTSTIGAQMQTATSVTLQYTPWHNKQQKVETLSLAGYGDATELLRFLQRGVR